MCAVSSERPGMCYQCWLMMLRLALRVELPARAQWTDGDLPLE